jgi:hypothetical protein
MSGTISALHSPRRSQDLHPFRPHHPVAIDPVAQLDALTLECRDGVLGYLPAYARHPGAQVDKLVASYRSRRVDSRASKNHLSWPGQVDQGAPPARRDVLVVMPAVCSKTTVGKTTS